VRGGKTERVTDFFNLKNGRKACKKKKKSGEIQYLLGSKGAGKRHTYTSSLSAAWEKKLD